MRLRDHVLGALNFSDEESLLAETELVIGQALADVATIGVLQHRAALQSHLLNEQLSHALNSRIVIEQAKGMLAERASLDMDAAFVWLRSYARNHNLRLADVAADVIGGKQAVASLDLRRPRLPS